MLLTRISSRASSGKPTWQVSVTATALDRHPDEVPGDRAIHPSSGCLRPDDGPAVHHLHASHDFTKTQGQNSDYPQIGLQPGVDEPRHGQRLIERRQERPRRNGTDQHRPPPEPVHRPTQQRSPQRAVRYQQPESTEHQHDARGQGCRRPDRRDRRSPARPTAITPRASATGPNTRWLLPRVGSVPREPARPRTGGGEDGTITVLPDGAHAERIRRGRLRRQRHSLCRLLPRHLVVKLIN